MDFPDLISGQFIQRDNRFRATVLLEGQKVKAHVRNSGALRDLFTKGQTVWLAPAVGAGRKTDYDLKLVELDSGLVSVDAHLPNKLFAETVHKGRLPPFPYQNISGEVRAGESRLDFHLTGLISQAPDQGEGASSCWVETKSVTLVEKGVALFPDVPTARGSRHLRQLSVLQRKGERAAVVFIVQRADAHTFAPYEAAADPLFAQTLRTAVNEGVEAYAYSCHVTLEEIQISSRIPVQLTV